MLRNFRDGYLVYKPGGPSLTDEYYPVAPAIDRQINRRKNADEIYDELYGLICLCVGSIKSGNPEAALETYEHMVQKLKHEYPDISELAERQPAGNSIQLRIS